MKNLKHRMNQSMSKALCLMLLVSICTLSACSAASSTESSETEQEWTVSITDTASDDSHTSSAESSEANSVTTESEQESAIDGTDEEADADVVIIGVEEMTSETDPEDGTVLVRVNHDANVRDAPSSKDSNVVTTVASGTELYAVSSDEYWTCVIIDGGYYYIYTPFLDVISGSFSD